MVENTQRKMKISDYLVSKAGYAVCLTIYDSLLNDVKFLQIIVIAKMQLI